MSPDDSVSVSLREFMDHRFKAVERELANVRSAIEKLAVEMVTRQQFDRVSAEVDELRREVDGLKATVRVWQYIGGLIATVLVALTIAWVRSLLGI